MKTLNIVIGILVVIIIGAVLYNVYTSNKSVTQKEFRVAHKYLNSRIDTLQKNVKILLNNQDTIIFNQNTFQNELDSLSAGQEIIYNEIIEGQNKVSFTRKLINFF